MTLPPDTDDENFSLDVLIKKVSSKKRVYTHEIAYFVASTV